MVRWRDLPNKHQLFILALCRLSEPLSNTCLLPYIYYLIRSTTTSDPQSADNGEASRVSELSGILVAAFPLAQFATSILWGRLSDSYGRKSTIVLGLLVSAVSNLAFGLSRTFSALLFWRILAGLANGNVGVMRTMTAEIVKERKYQTRAFLLLPLIFNSGMVAALALGGSLADPVVNIPWLFGAEGLLNLSGNPAGVSWALKYPYALPALFNAAVLGTSLITATLGLRETLESLEHTPDAGSAIGRSLHHYAHRLLFRSKPEYSTIPLDETCELPLSSDVKTPLSEPSATVTRPSLLSSGVIWTPATLAALVSFGLLPLHNSAYMHILPVYLSTPSSSYMASSLVSFTGGLGLRSPSIGLYLSLLGIGGITLQLFIYPLLQARIGTLSVFRIALFIFPATYALTPFLSLLAEGSWARPPTVALVVWSQIMARTLAIPSTVILLTESVEQKSVLGTVHGAGNMLASLARAVGPAVGGSVFAWGLKHGVVGAAWWTWLMVVAVVALAASYLMKGKEDE